MSSIEKRLTCDIGMLRVAWIECHSLFQVLSCGDLISALEICTADRGIEDSPHPTRHLGELVFRHPRQARKTIDIAEAATAETKNGIGIRCFRRKRKKRSTGESIACVHV
jgi:hypothetical protein